MARVRTQRGRGFWRWVGRVLTVLVPVLAVLALIERRCELRDRELYASHETFAELEGGAKVEYRLTGQGHSGPTVVLLNGFSATLEQWDPTQTELARFSQVLSYDAGGTGYSTGSRAHDAWDQAEELARLLDALHIQGRIVLVGYSASGSLSRVFAARYPERMAGLVLLVPYLPEMDVKYPERRGELRWLGRTCLSATVETLFGLRRAALFLGLSHFADHPPRTELERRGQAIFLYFPSWLAADKQLLKANASAKQGIAAQVRAPLMVLRSSENDVPHYPEFVDQFTAAHHGELRILDGIAHSDVLTDPRSVQGVVQGIVDLARQTMAR
ncbi:MAG: alpha/beta fold hydrolase [Pseudomonadota bacterium]